MASSITIVYNNPSQGEECDNNCMVRVANGSDVPPIPAPTGYAFVYALNKKVYLPDGVTPILVPIEYANI